MNRNVLRRFRLIAVMLLVALALPVAQTTFAQGGSSAPVDVEVVGVITALDATTITVNGQTIDISTAEITTADPLALDMAVRVQGTIQTDGSIVARQVSDAATGLQPGEIEVTGALESLDATTAVVNGLTFDISTAEIAAGLVPGDSVRVHASYDAATATWIASEIVAATPAPGSDIVPFEVTGTLESVDGTTYVVAGLTFDASQAQVEAGLLPGMLVRVHASLVNGALVAIEIAAAQQTVPAPDCATTLPDGWYSYTVRPGDTLSGIALRAQTTVEELIRVNCVDNPRLLVVNTIIFVPNAPAPVFDDRPSDDDSNDDHGDDSGDDSNDDQNDDSNDDHSANVDQNTNNTNPSMDDSSSNSQDDSHDDSSDDSPDSSDDSSDDHHDDSHDDHSDDHSDDHDD